MSAKTVYVGNADQLRSIAKLIEAMDTIPEDNEYYIASPVPVQYSEDPGGPPVGQLVNDGAGWAFHGLV